MKKPKTFAQKAKRFLLTTLLVLLVLALGAGSFAYFGNYSTGTRAGVVMKLSEKGYVFKTHEGQLDVGGLEASKDGKMTSVFYFSVDEDQKQILEMLQEVSLRKERVTLHYDEKFFIFPWRGDTKYFVTKIDRLEELEKEKPTPKEEQNDPEPKEETPLDSLEADPRDV